MKLRTIGMAAVAALALVAGRAEAQDAGWDTKYGILFTLPNPFGGASGVNVISDFSGKVGGQYNLTPNTGIRAGVNLTRRSAGIVETDVSGVKSKTVPAETSYYGANLSAAYLLRLGSAAVAPYGGAGAFVDFSRSARKGDAEAAGVVTKYDNSTVALDFGLMGTAGLEWRIHKVIALFAEYQADLTLIGTNSAKTYTKVGPAAATTSDSSSKHFLGLTTGIGQAGRIGVLAFF